MTTQNDQNVESLLKQIRRLGRELAVAQDRQVYYENAADQNQNLLNTRIQELEKAREALNRRGLELAQSEKRFQSLADAAFEAILIHDKEVILDVNDNALALYGYPRDQFINMKLLSLVHPDSQHSVVQLFSVNIKDDTYLETLNVRADGSVFSVDMHSKGMNLDEGDIIHVTAVRDVTERKQMIDELKRLASTDVLTSVNNRRNFLELGSNELQRAQRYAHPLTVMMLDIDHFKMINDNYGHDAGDEALKAFACACMSALRNTDILGRLGGEEFAVILPETPAHSAVDVAERIRATVELLKVRRGKQVINMTVSIGLTGLQDEDRSLDLLLKRADQALYQAKSLGRNRFIIA
ncbi:MAG: diguanylate cyclase [Gammaproteobacteria bacterium]|nr:diguanylate cyclase [Gammaproteobacteria bacterium]